LYGVGFLRSTPSSRRVWVDRVLEETATEESVMAKSNTAVRKPNQSMLRRLARAIVAGLAVVPSRLARLIRPWPLLLVVSMTFGLLGAVVPAEAAVADLEISNELIASEVVSSVTHQMMLTYELRVVNPGVAAESFTPSQELKFGTGITIDAVSLTAVPAGTAGTVWDGTSTTQLSAAAVTIASGEVMTWRMVITVTPDAAATAIGSTSGDCVLAGGETGTGFLATAKVAPGSTPSADRCVASILPTMIKTATVSSGPDAGSSTTVRAGDTVDWKIQVDLDLPGQGSVTDLLPTGTTYVPGSLEFPSPWSMNYTTSAGGAWATSPPAAGINGFRADIPVGDKVGYRSGSSAFNPPPPAVSVQAGTGGDGYVPLPVGNKVYNVFHHQSARLNCTVKLSSANCFPGTTGYFFQRVDGATLTNTRGSAAIAVNNRAAATYVAATNEMWVVGDGMKADGSSDGTGGFACMNLNTTPPKACDTSFVQAVAGQGAFTMSGPQTYYVRFGYVGSDPSTSRVFAQDDSSQIYCLDTVAHALCAGWTVTSAAGLGTAPASNGHFSSGVFASAGRILVTNNAGAVDYSTCIDMASGLRCAGWPAVPAVMANDNNASYVSGTPAPQFTGGNFVTPTGACYVHHNFAPDSTASTTSVRITTCVSLADGSATAVPANYETSYPVNKSSKVPIGEITSTPDGKVFQAWDSSAYFNAEADDVYSCYDYAIGDVCAGWLGGKDYSGPSASEHPYATVVDDQDPSCVWALGDAGNLRSFDSVTGGLCSTATAKFTVDPRSFYCAASTPVITGWTDFKLRNLSALAYGAAFLTIRDQSGAIVAPYNSLDITAAIAGGTLDLSAIAYAGDQRTLTFDLRLRGANAPMFSVTPKPYVAAAWAGPQVEMCFKTTVADVCTVNKVENSAEFAWTPDAGGSVAATSSRSFEYVASGSCLQTTKSVASGPTPNGDGTYAIAYDVSVSNTSPGRSSYDLDDQFQFGTGITVAAAPTVVNTTPGGVAANSAWNGTSSTRVVTGLSIQGSATHIYRVTANASAPADLTAAAADCALAGDETGTGLRNSASVTAEVNSPPASVACAAPPSLTITKSVASGPTANVDGSWTISYDITATNNGGAAGPYDLFDTLHFGSDISVRSAAVTASPTDAALASPPWNGSSNFGIVMARDLSAGASETFTVTVVAESPDGVSAIAADCTLDAGETGTGFRNTASAVQNGLSTTLANACAPFTNVIDAVDNDYGTVAGGGRTGSVLLGDTLNGGPASLLNVVVTPGVSPNPGLVMNLDGTITVDPATPSGVYNYPYTICSKIDPTVCDTAIATLKVDPQITAWDDDYRGRAGGRTPSVFENDTLNGKPVSPENVTLTPGESPDSGLVMNPDGTISIGADVPSGEYHYPYTICSIADPAVCATAEALVSVPEHTRLPVTGSNPRTPLVLAVAFVLAGSAFGLVGRRRRRAGR
jgi:hypothetical protein